MRIIRTSLNNVLSLISCAVDYGFDDIILFEALADMLDNNLSDQEIEVYAKHIESLEGYSKKDYKEIKDRLIDFRNNYCK